MTWTEVIAKLTDWRDNGVAHMADDIDPPTQKAIAKALGVAAKSKTRREVLRVVPDGDGGIVFEYPRVVETQTMEIDSNGLATGKHMKDGKSIRCYILSFLVLILFATPAHAVEYFPAPSDTESVITLQSLGVAGWGTANQQVRQTP